MGSSNSTLKYYHLDPSTYATEAKFDGAIPESREDASEVYKSFDYIIVGGGTAGCVLASRLSENAQVSVLLVEAGPNHESKFMAKLPIGMGKMIRSECDWRFMTPPQEHANGRMFFWPRGKIMGGCSSINAQMAHHGHPTDFSEWERLGAPGWTYEELTPYFQKAETFTDSKEWPGVKAEDRGASGPWQTRWGYCSPSTKAFIKASQEVGIPYNPDMNTPQGTSGVGKTMASIDQKGCRSSSASAYITEEVLKRPSLTIATETYVTRVLVTNGAAVGIEVSKGFGEPVYRVAAKQSVILCAGAFHTPHLLMLSGIGPRDELEPFNIPVIKELPAVGKYLWEHLGVPINFRCDKSTTIDFIKQPLVFLPYILWWMITGTGPAISNVAEAAVFVNSKDERLPFSSHASKLDASSVVDNSSGPGAPDVEIVGCPIFPGYDGQKLLNEADGCFEMLVTSVRPLSSGTVGLASSSAFDKPLTNPHYLSNPNDMLVLNRGIRLALRIARASSFQSTLQLKKITSEADINKNDPFWLGDMDPDTVTDEQIEEWSRAKAQTVYHPVGTARMGQDPATSVVGPDLKVHGISGLRVLDASVFPSQISGHPMAVIIAMAEKTADMILNEHAATA